MGWTDLCKRIQNLPVFVSMSLCGLTPLFLRTTCIKINAYWALSKKPLFPPAFVLGEADTSNTRSANEKEQRHPRLPESMAHV